MKKAIITTSVAFVLLLAVVAAGLNVIFTVSYVEASFSTFSVQGGNDAQELKKELDGFIGDSMTFLDLGDVEETIAKYPSFRVESVRKKFPKTVEVVVKERRELFAYATEEGYAMIDTEGNCLRVSEENVSRTGGENILLKNFTLNAAVGSRAEGDYFDALLSVFAGFGEYLSDPRANVREVGLLLGGNDSNPLMNRFRIEMQEGVVIEMSNLYSNAQAKARKAMEVYGRLGDVTKMYGRITVAESAAGEINAVYFERGE